MRTKFNPYPEHLETGWPHESLVNRWALYESKDGVWMVVWIDRKGRAWCHLYDNSALKGVSDDLEEFYPYSAERYVREECDVTMSFYDKSISGSEYLSDPYWIEQHYKFPEDK